MEEGIVPVPAVIESAELTEKNRNKNKSNYTIYKKGRNMNVVNTFKKCGLSETPSISAPATVRAKLSVYRA